MTTAIAKQGAGAINASEAPASLFQFTSFREALEAAKFIAASTMIPDRYRHKPADIVVCWQYGAEIGMQPMQSLQSIAVINGMPGLYGDGLLGVVMAHHSYRGKVERSDKKKGYCQIKRAHHGELEVTEQEFTIDEANDAQLTGKGPWKAYPARMLKMRARGFAVRDAFADVLKGFKTVEELQDYPRVQVQAMPEQATAPKVEVAESPQSAEPSETLTAVLAGIEVASSVEDLQRVRPNGTLAEQERAVAALAWKVRKRELQAAPPPPPVIDAEELPDFGDAPEVPFREPPTRREIAPVREPGCDDDLE